MLENKILPHHQPFQVLIPGKKITVVKNGSHRRSWPPHQWTHRSHHRPNQNRHQQLHACKITYTVQIFVILTSTYILAKTLTQLIIEQHLKKHSSKLTDNKKIYMNRSKKRWMELNNTTILFLLFPMNQLVIKMEGWSQSKIDQNL